eukprot:scaffold18900_cov101-Isochrysis_galbana.AAC.4
MLPKKTPRSLGVMTVLTSSLIRSRPHIPPTALRIVRRDRSSSSRSVGGGCSARYKTGQSGVLSAHRARGEQGKRTCSRSQASQYPAGNGGTPLHASSPPWELSQPRCQPGGGTIGCSSSSSIGSSAPGSTPAASAGPSPTPARLLALPVADPLLPTGVMLVPAGGEWATAVVWATGGDSATGGDWAPFKHTCMTQAASTRRAPAATACSSSGSSGAPPAGPTRMCVHPPGSTLSARTTVPPADTISSRRSRASSSAPSHPTQAMTQARNAWWCRSTSAPLLDKWCSRGSRRDLAHASAALTVSGVLSPSAAAFASAGGAAGTGLLRAAEVNHASSVRFPIMVVLGTVRAPGFQPQTGPGKDREGGNARNRSPRLHESALSFFFFFPSPFSPHLALSYGK